MSQVHEEALASWRDFHGYVHAGALKSTQYIWRGQRDAAWTLNSGLDRSPPEAISVIAQRHLERFKLASRGRRGANSSQHENDNEWWALAQHNAMLTPLLDWTDSPFVALYFAFEKEQKPSSGTRAVWALLESVVIKPSERPMAEDIGRHRREVALARQRRRAFPAERLAFIRPMQDDNSRLVSQAGLFTKVPAGASIEQWLEQNADDEPESHRLIKITMPDQDRKECLRSLNRMNINHLSLFPDLYGAGRHCNNALEINFD